MNETEAYWKRRYAILLEEIDDRFGLLIVGAIEVDVSKRMQENETEAYWKRRYAILLEEIDDRFGLLIVGAIEVDVSKRMREESKLPTA